MDRIAVIDIGTNSIKLLLAEMGVGGQFVTILEKNSVTRLGEGLKDRGSIGPDIMNRSVVAVRDFAQAARDEGAKEIHVVGTMALRNAANSDLFIELVRAASGVEVRILSGEEEARYSYLAVLSGINLGDDKFVIIDTGGGSTEFVFGRNGSLDRRFSLDLGAVDITESFLVSDPVTKQEVGAARRHIEALLEKNGVGEYSGRLIGVGGAITSMGAVMRGMAAYDAGSIQGSYLCIEEVERQINMYSAKSIEERRLIVGLQPRRADIILAGALIVSAIIGRIGDVGLTISHRGLRHGLLFDIGSGRKQEA